MVRSRQLKETPSAEDAQAKKQKFMELQTADMLKRRQWLFGAFLIGASVIMGSCIIAGTIGGAQSGTVPW